MGRLSDDKKKELAKEEFDAKDINATATGLVNDAINALEKASRATTVGVRDDGIDKAKGTDALKRIKQAQSLVIGISLM